MTKPLALALIAGLAAGAPHQQPPPSVTQAPPVTFKVEVNYVEVDAVVTDARGGFVEDLRREDFQVLEDGKPQEVTAFSLVRLPVERAEAPLFVRSPIEPDVASNARPIEGRVYLLVLDDLHTTPENTPLVREAARRFIESRLGANDIAAVVSTRGRESSQEFTANRRLLAAAIDRFMGQGLRSGSLNRLEDDYNRVGQLPPRDAEDHERRYNARSTLATLRRLAEFMADVRGRRKALVLFSEGIDYRLLDTSGSGAAATGEDSTTPLLSRPATGELALDTFEAIAAATRANVSIYAVDARGLAGPAAASGELAAVPATADPSFRLGSIGMQDEQRLAHEALRVLSEETGGFALLNTNDLSAGFDRIREDNSRYYVFGYYPANSRRDGKFRRIEVRVSRPGLTVRARRGYVAPRGKPRTVDGIEAREGTSPALLEALNSPLPVSGLRLGVSAAPFRGAGRNASVLLVVQAEGADLRFDERDGRFEGRLEISGVAVDREGKVRDGVRRSLTLPLKPESHAIVARHGLRMVERLDLPPGTYQVRLGALDQASGRVGSVHYDLQVPDFSQPPLALSGVVLTSSNAGLTPTPGEADELAALLPGPPTVVRRFRAGEELAALAEVYDNRGSTPHRVEIVTTLRSDDGREVFRRQDAHGSEELRGARGGYGHMVRMPLKGLDPGLYLLKVEARSTLADTPGVSREVLVRVERAEP
jgi:VWFA-related protein